MIAALVLGLAIRANTDSSCTVWYAGSQTTVTASGPRARELCRAIVADYPGRVSVQQLPALFKEVLGQQPYVLCRGAWGRDTVLVRVGTWDTRDFGSRMCEAMQSQSAKR